jgi:hypothetical protein
MHIASRNQFLCNFAYDECIVVIVLYCEIQHNLHWSFYWCFLNLFVFAYYWHNCFLQSSCILMSSISGQIRTTDQWNYELTYVCIYCHDLGVTIDRVLDWWVNLLTTYTRDLELQTITALLLIYTLYRSLQHTLSPFLLESSLVVAW